MSTQVFRLAPMSLALRILTSLLLLLPVAFVYGAWVSPPPESAAFTPMAAFFLLVYASVWLLWRPTKFEVLPHALRIVWPVRARGIARASIESARIITGADFRKEYGYGVRMGAGGLWGGFGWLRTGRETFSMWVSRTDQFVIVRIRGAKSLLITPEDPERFIRVLGGSGGGNAASGGAQESLP